jgi:hypothetical protein
VLQRAADRKGIQAIRQLQDAVTLLFSHATYKSYPESFLDRGQWDKMNQWASTLSTRGEELLRIDVSHVSDLDSWLALLDQHGFAFCHSSGSSGKPSFVSLGKAAFTLPGVPHDALELMRRACKWIVNEINPDSTTWR